MSLVAVGIDVVNFVVVSLVGIDLLAVGLVVVVNLVDLFAVDLHFGFGFYPVAVIGLVVELVAVGVVVEIVVVVVLVGLGGGGGGFVGLVVDLVETFYCRLLSDIWKYYCLDDLFDHDIIVS